MLFYGKHIKSIEYLTDLHITQYKWLWCCCLPCRRRGTSASNSCWSEHSEHTQLSLHKEVKSLFKCIFSAYNSPSTCPFYRSHIKTAHLQSSSATAMCSAINAGLFQWWQSQHSTQKPSCNLQPLSYPLQDANSKNNIPALSSLSTSQGYRSPDPVILSYLLCCATATTKKSKIRETHILL